MTTTEAAPRCRMTNRRGERCTGEVLDPDPKVVQACQRHAAEVMELITDHQKRSKR